MRIHPNMFRGVSTLLMCTLMLIGVSQQTFTNIAGAGADQSNIAFAKDGGCSFADYDLDGDLDLVVNTNDNNSTRRSYLLRNDNGVYTDVTNAVAPGLKSNERTERTATWGDCNNDGYPDLMVNWAFRLKILINNAGASFTLHSNITSMTDGMNTEGAGWMDYDNDGDLDFFVENDEHGVDMFDNDGSTPNPVFTHITSDAVGPVGAGAGGIGLPEGGSTDGDFATAVDLNIDGYVDIIARRRNNGTLDGQDNNPYDIFMSDGDGTYTPNTAFNERGNNSDKGAILTGDFDNDGDFDIIWTSGTTDAGRAALYENVGSNSMNFVLVPNPFKLDNGTADLSTDSEGAAMADIDHDGDIDVFFTRVGGGPGILYLNNSTGAGNFDFRQPGPTWIPGAALNYGINIAANGQGCVFADFDNDGDADLYVNRNGSANQLWRNDYIGSAAETAATYQNNYIRIIPLVDLGSGITRPALNATVTFLDCDGNPIGGVREIGSGGAGHGSQTTPWLIFGLLNGPDASYTIEVQYTRNGTTPVVVRKAIIPSQIPDLNLGASTLTLEQTLIIQDTDEDEEYFCQDTDGDDINDFFDLDDDNDGIPDTEETEANALSFQPPCIPLALDFSGVPTLVSGAALQEGAVYKFSGISGTTDALVTIEDAFNGTVPNIDANASDPTYFKPQTAFNLGSIGDQAYIEYRFQFVTGVAETPVNLAELFINFNDIDGNANYSEENWAQYPVSYFIDNPTTLTINVDDWVRATAGTVDFAGASNINPEVNMGVRYLNVSELRVRVGAIANVAGASSGGRQHSLQFACIANFVDPTTYFIDFDEDGVINSLDLDSDNDGIFDSVEAGHGELDADNNGVIDGIPGDFGTNGLFDGVETVPDNGILDYTVSDSDADGNIDAQELDSDNDGCNDVIEAGYSDPDDNGLLGTGN